MSPALKRRAGRKPPLTGLQPSVVGFLYWHVTECMQGIMDIGKSIAVFVLAIIGLQLAECGWMLITQKFSETWILKGLVVAGVGSFFVVKFWRHDDSLRRWTLSFCKAAYFLFPTIILLGLILGHPMSITLPFLHTRTDSPIIVAGLGVGALAYVVLVHVLLSSRRAIAEFVDKNALPAGQ